MRKKYLQDHLKSILFALCTVGLFVLICCLYEQLIPPVIYASVILIVVGSAVLWAGYPRYEARMKYIAELTGCSDPEGCADHLPTPASCEIEMYQELLKSMGSSYREYVSLEDEKYRDRSDYFAMWAHQIKTPIAAMHLLIDDQDMPEEKDQLFRIEEYVSMVMHYLKTDDISKDFVLRSYSLDQILEEAIRHYSSLFIRKKLKLNYEHTNLQVVTDEKWLLFVVEQILSNSLKYTSAGSVTIKAEHGSLIISDTGCGIASEDLPRMFDKGYTGYNGRMDKRSTGLGLYLCKKVLDQLGHSIHIESSAGKGTSVIIGLNLSEQ
ncbi:MAG: sensor histidine kinase [Solobacterium sp.]|jgi:signal transduction histidine kinase|nr:sensor histidine kinase [Solobacterium sp.]MCH4222360.1 sensor histidine kinase [Solobacterium sp.]MCH4265101.1 sensor histidine kinase [Solobacterium sp.]